MSKWHLKARSYPHGRFVSVWLIRRDATGESWALWGEVLPASVDEIAAATGLKVERDESPWNAEPQTVPEAKAADLPSLF